MTLYVDGVKARRVRTDQLGYATFPLSLDLPLGTYQLQAVYQGSPLLAAATASVQLSLVPIPITVEVIPPLAGIRFELNGKSFVSDATGVAVTTVDLPGTYTIQLRTDQEDRLDYRIKFDRWRAEVFDMARTVTVPLRGPLQVGYMVSYPIQERFTDLDGKPVDLSRITSWSYLSSHGALLTYDTATPHWLDANRIMRRRLGLEYVPIQYSLESVIVDGANVVNRKQQRFFAEQAYQTWPISLIFFPAKFTPIDALFGTPIGSGVALSYPDGNVVLHHADGDGIVALDALARGLYTVQAVGVSGVAPETPVAITRVQDVSLRVVSQLDIGLALGLGIILALALLLIGRPHLILLFHPRTWVTAIAAVLHHSVTLFLVRLLGIIGGIILLLLTACRAPAVDEIAVDGDEALAYYRTAENRPPLFAYYYIWFDPTSWDRAKRDLPLLGRYSSFDRSTMRQHIRWAKAAGIEGFIVSWRGSDRLNERLASLATIAAQEQFALALIYQGLDFEREPIATEKIAADLDYFVATYRDHPAFQRFGRPLVIWGGTWGYSTAQIGAVVEPLREQLLLLASERNRKEYERLADLVDGDAYYWGALNPDTYPNYPGKLIEMGAAVHAHGGLWIAPAAPGFDARMVGGTSVVERADGAIFRRQLAGALTSSPDLVGIISWNEFSENTHIEPSTTYGLRYLALTAALAGADPSRLQSETLSVGNRPAVSLAYGLPALVVALVMIGISVVYRVQRNTRRLLSMKTVNEP